MLGSGAVVFDGDRRLAEVLLLRVRRSERADDRVVASSVASEGLVCQ